MGWWKRRSGTVKALLTCWPLTAVIAVSGLAFASGGGTVNAKSLNKSIQWEYDWEHEVAIPDCERLNQNHWRCAVTNSNLAVPDGYYVVKTYDGSSWWAKRLGSDTSEFGRSAPRILSGYVDKDDAGEAPPDSVFWLAGLLWLALLLTPLFVWLTLRFRDKPPPETPPTRPVGPNPEKPGA